VPPADQCHCIENHIKPLSCGFAVLIAEPESPSRHRGGPMPNRWCVNYTDCRFNAELTTRCLCWHICLRSDLYCVGWGVKLYSLTVLTYKTLKTSVPQYLSQRINRRVNARTLRSRATPLLIQPFARTDFAKCSYRCAAPSVWNSLHASVIGSDSLSVLKSRLKTYLFRKFYN